jgi:hypothetical protein
MKKFQNTIFRFDLQNFILITQTPNVSTSQITEMQIKKIHKFFWNLSRNYMDKFAPP